MTVTHSTSDYSWSVALKWFLRTAPVAVARQPRMVAHCDDTESDGKSSGCSHGSKTFAAWSLDMNITPSISWALFNSDALLSSRDNFETASSFTGWTNYMMDFGTLMKDPVAIKNFGSTMVIWDLKAMKPKKVFNVPGAPLEVRWNLAEGANWAITATALTSKLWLVKQDSSGEWQARDVANIGDPAKTPLPVDISITADGKGLWVGTFTDGKTRYFDISNPEAPKQIYEKVIGKQVNMVSQSWDGKRICFTSSLVANWDKKGADDDQFLRAYAWDGKSLEKTFEVDFYALKLGRAHHMKFSARPENVASMAPRS